MSADLSVLIEDHNLTVYSAVYFQSSYTKDSFLDPYATIHSEISHT